MRPFGIIFGIVFLILGIAGFVSDFNPENHVLSLFSANLWLNCLYVISSLLGFFVGFWTIKSAQFYFQIIGVIYALLAILGFIYGEREILNIFASNNAHTWLHVILAVAALILGYGGKN